jgi:D-tyrosyl-tRNA(Tyr) deacylase
MTAVLQRILNGSVSVEGKVAGAAGKGLMILLGVAGTDTEEDAEKLAAKIIKLRIFSDGAGKMNLSVKDTGGEALIVSNFTLMADCRHGNRPDFLRSAPPERARELYEYFVRLMRAEIPQVGTGIFGAHMEINIVCDGPVTIVMDSADLKKSAGRTGASE